jgi:hypothetical protein
MKVRKLLLGFALALVVAVGFYSASQPTVVLHDGPPVPNCPPHTICN